MNVERATPADFPAIRWLLSFESQPWQDLTELSLSQFLVIREQGQVHGAIGLECYGEVALLRSLVVSEELRGLGYGGKLVAAAESRAEQLSVRSIYLLTNTAADFFVARGFRRISRDDAPSAVKATAQFSALCPSTAVLMVKP